MEAIRKAVEETTPHKKPCPHSKRWWSNKLTKLRREANQLRNKYKRTWLDTDKTTWRSKANEYTYEIAQVKLDKWKEFVDNADEKSI